MHCIPDNESIDFYVWIYIYMNEGREREREKKERESRRKRENSFFCNSWINELSLFNLTQQKKGMNMSPIRWRDTLDMPSNMNMGTEEHSSSFVIKYWTDWNSMPTMCFNTNRKVSFEYIHCHQHRRTSSLLLSKKKYKVIRIALLGNDFEVCMNTNTHTHDSSLLLTYTWIIIFFLIVLRSIRMEDPRCTMMTGKMAMWNRRRSNEWDERDEETCDQQMRKEILRGIRQLTTILCQFSNE